MNGEQMFFDAYTGSVMAIAHRGARSLAPENTLFAVSKARHAGAYAWEMDVQMTRDGQLVITHDETINRVSNVAFVPEFLDRKPWRVKDFTLAELRSLDFGSWYVREDPFGQIAAGAVSATDAETYRGALIPTLEEGLRMTREHGFRINVEIKDLSGLPGDDVVTRKVLEMIDRFDLVEQAILSSFQFKYLLQARDILPELPTAALVEEENMPEGDILTVLQNLGVQAWHPDKDIVKADDLRRVRDAGLFVNVYTVNDLREMRFLMNKGVTGLITDFPQRVRGL
ncbi:MAG: glycerophosphodiester phosphodiesterase family protein [Desulfoplanes sp.]